MGVRPIISNETSENANREALHWLIALQEEPNDEDVLTRFDVWLRSSRENEQAWAEAQRVWNLLGDTGKAPVSTTRRSANDMAGYTRPRSTRWGWRRLALATAGVSALCLAVLIQPAITIWLTADYSTSTAESRDIRLEDGSIVHLGADSAITVKLEATVRHVRLLSGEAYFEVEPDKGRPFKVDAGNVETTVLGTAFDVRMMTDGVAVAVNHGRVGVAAEQIHQELDTPLEAGDWVRLGWNGDIERGKDAPDLVGGWRSGMLVVKDWPIADVIDQIRRHYGGKIILADNTLGKQRVTGVYNMRNPIDALRAVVQAHGADTRQVSPWVTIVSRY
ncbi:FecR family protein [Rhizobium sp. LEGMi135b]